MGRATSIETIVSPTTSTAWFRFNHTGLRNKSERAAPMNGDDAYVLLAAMGAVFLGFVVVRELILPMALGLFGRRDD